MVKVAADSRGVENIEASLAVLRGLIETEDREIARHLVRRRELSERVGRVKRQIGLPTYDRERESELTRQFRFEVSAHEAIAKREPVVLESPLSMLAGDVHRAVLAFCKHGRPA